MVVSPAWMVVGGFVAGMAALSRYLQAREEDGSFDAPPSSVSSPGMRRLFDYGPGGWSEDGSKQPPTSR